MHLTLYRLTKKKIAVKLKRAFDYVGDDDDGEDDADKCRKKME